MPRSAPSLPPPRQAVLLLTDRDRPRREEALRSPAERVLLVATWVGVVGFCLAFWTAVTLLLAR